MSRYNRESEQPVFSFMDGVPVKISEQFKPPRKVGLPHGYQQRMSIETTNEEYDFNLENSILQNIGEWRKIRKDAVDRRKERLKAEDEMEKQKNCQVGSPVNQIDPVATVSTAVSPAPIPPSSTSYTNSVTSFTSNTSILTPMQISQPTRQVRTSPQFNFSDFEADTSSPFDNMELKTINEMEVLAHVLQPLSHSPDSNRNASCYSGIVSHNCDAAEKRGRTVDNHETHNTVAYPLNSNVPQDQASYFASNNISQPSYDFYQQETLSMGDSHSRIDHQDVVVQNLDRMSIANPTNSGYSPNRFVQSHSIPIKSFGHSTQFYETDTYSNQILNSYNVASLSDAGDNESVAFPPSSQTSDRAHSTSVPDIVQELEKELRNRTHTLPTPRPNSFGSTGLENWKPWPTLESPQNHRSYAKQRSPSPPGATNLPPASRLSNPYSELSLAAQRMSQHISEMGFSQPRVARACKAIGVDERKVVDFLLQVQALESDGYSGDAVERALLATDFDQSKAVEHLEAMKQLLDLGFNEDQIFEALLRFDNDRDKALDHLIS